MSPQTRWFTTREGRRLAYWDVGEGPIVAFSHGLLWSKEMYGPQIQALSGRYRCIAWDHPGQGESQVVPGSVTSIDQCADAAAQLLTSLADQPVHFVGLSMGGFTGMRLAARRPDLIRSLANLCTAADPEPVENLPKYRRLNLAARLFGVRRFLAQRVAAILFGRSFLDDPARADEREHWTQRLMATNGRRVYRAVNGVLYRDSILDEVAGIAVPVLQLHGDEDVAIKLHRAEATAAAIPGAQLVVLPGTGHSMTIETPPQVNQALADFLARVG